MNRSKSRSIWMAGLAMIVAASCIRIANYSETEYQYAINLKVESLQLMSRATTAYSANQVEADKLRTDLAKAYEYAAGRPDNQISTEQWGILKDDSKNLLGGFLRRWEAEKTLGAPYIDEKKAQIGKAFDEIS